jgi:hypothetical protein
MDVLRAALDALQLFHNVPNAHDANEHNVFSSDTGEMMRDAASGRLVVSAPQFQALCGNLNGVGRVLAPGLRVRNMNSGTLIALSLDGRPLVESRRFMIKMVTDARNKDEVAGPDTRISSVTGKPIVVPNQWRLDVLGEGPVTTFGRSATVPMQISIENRPLLDVYLERGTFELLVDGNDWKFYSDTPGTRFALHNTVSKPIAQANAQPAESKPGAKSENKALSFQEILPDGTVRPLSPLSVSATGGPTVVAFPQKAALVQAQR